MTPGWGNRPTSGALPPATRARISVSQDAALVNLTVKPFSPANLLRSAWKACSWASPKPYITSTLDLPGPLAVPVLPAPPESLEPRQPLVSSATVPPAATALVKVAVRMVVSPLVDNKRETVAGSRIGEALAGCAVALPLDRVVRASGFQFM